MQGTNAKLILASIALVVLSVHSCYARSVFGLCRRIDIFSNLQENHKVNGLNEQERNLVPTTKVHWKADDEQIVVKYKMDLKTLCRKFEAVTGTVQKDLRSMLFYRSNRPEKKVVANI